MKLHNRVGVTYVLRVSDRENDPLIQCQKQLFNGKRFVVVINHFQYLDIETLVHNRILLTIPENRYYPLFIGCAELIVLGKKVKEKKYLPEKGGYCRHSFVEMNTTYELSENNQMKQKEVILRKKSSKKKVKGVGNLRIMM